MYLSTKDLETYIEEPRKYGSSKEIQRADKKAKSIICTCLSDQLLSSVINEPSAFATWTKIQDTFQKKSTATHTRIVKDFWNLTKGDSSIADYVSSIQALSQKLKCTGKKMTDDDLIDKILSGLNPKQNLQLRSMFSEFRDSRKVHRLDHRFRMLNTSLPQGLGLKTHKEAAPHLKRGRAAPVAHALPRLGHLTLHRTLRYIHFTP